MPALSADHARVSDLAVAADRDPPATALGLYVHVPFCEVKCTDGRSRGVGREAFRRRYGVDPLDEFGPALAEAFAARLREVREGSLRLTDEGVLVSNEVFRALV